MIQKSFIVKCKNCGTKNRIPLARAGENPICGKCHRPLDSRIRFPERAIDIDERAFGSEVSGFAGPVIILFWATWCGHCRRLLPIFDELAVHYAGLIKFIKIDMDRNPGLASQYEVQSVPTMLLFKNGNLINRLVGALSKDQLEYSLRIFQ